MVTSSGALPRRPLTVGELLDAAVQLVRTKAVLLVPVALILAVGEQAALYPMRQALGINRFEFWHNFGWWWVGLAIGSGLEVLIIVVLGVPMGRVVAADLAGERLSGRALLVPGWRAAGSATMAAPVAASATAIGMLLGPFWVLGYALFGMAGAAIGMERRGPLGALGRSTQVAFRLGMRATGVRVLGYLGWLLLRLAFLIGMIRLVDFLPLPPAASFWIITGSVVIANAAAYLFLASLDATTLAETRFRSEGLDIWLARSQQHGGLSRQALAVKR